MASRIIPQFEEIIENTGFDKNAAPRWQLIETTGTRFVDLTNAAGMLIRNITPNIAAITEDTTFGVTHTRRFEITGSSPGTAFIEVINPLHGGVVQRLEVRVKDKLPLNIAFHFVEDNLYRKTITSTTADFMRQLRFNLNNIFELQAAVNLNITREKDVHIETNIDDIVGKQDQYNLASGDALKGPYQEWFKLTAEGDPKALINVFFVPRSFKTPPSLIFGADGNIVIVDPEKIVTEKTERILGHWICYMLGCSFASNRRSLMFRNPPEYDGGRFISKGNADFLYQILTP